MAKKFGGLGKGLDAIFMENESENSNKSITLKISELEPNRNQPRKDFDENALMELAESIKKHGLIQPILVRPIIGGGYQIVAGERRYRACRMAGLTEVPVTIRELGEEETMEVALIENLQRENLNPFEEALGYKRLIDEYNLSQEQVASAVGKSRPAIANTLRLLNLAEAVIALLKEGKISSGHGRALLAVEDEQEQIRIANAIVAEDLSVRQVEKMVKKKEVKEKESKPQPIVPYYKMVEQSLGENLGKKVKVSSNKGKKGGILQIEFYSDEELKELALKLEEK